MWLDLDNDIDGLFATIVIKYIESNPLHFVVAVDGDEIFRFQWKGKGCLKWEDKQNERHWKILGWDDKQSLST